MKLITTVDIYGAVHIFNEAAITEFQTAVPNEQGCGAIELNNGRRIIVKDRQLKQIVESVQDEGK